MCMRVANLDEGDWKQLKRLLEYLKGTRDSEHLTLGSDNLSIMKSYINGVHGGVNNDFKGNERRRMTIPG